MRRVRVGRIRLEGDIVHLGEGVGSERGVGRKELPDVKRRCRVVALGLKPLPFALSPFRDGFPGIRAGGGRSRRRAEGGVRRYGRPRFGVAGARRPGGRRRTPFCAAVELLRRTVSPAARPGRRAPATPSPGGQAPPKLRFVTVFRGFVPLPEPGPRKSLDLPAVAA